MDPTQFQSILNSYNRSSSPSSALPTATAPAPQAPAPNDKGSWLSRLLPTLGGVAGGILGEVVDPFGGGIAGAALGAGLAGAGSAAGKAAENASEGKSVGSDVVKTGLEGAIGQGIGSAGGAAASKLIGKFAPEGASKLLQGQFAKGTIDKSTADQMIQSGLTTGNQIAKVAPQITGSDGLFTKGLSQSLNDASDSGVVADIQGMDRYGQELLNNNTAITSNSVVKKLSDKVDKSIQNMVGPGDVGTVPLKNGSQMNVFTQGSQANALPQRVFEQTKQYEQWAQDAYNHAFDKIGNPINSEQKAVGDFWKQMADESKSRAFGTASAEASPIPISDTARQGMEQELSLFQKTNPQLYGQLKNQLDTAQFAHELRPIQAPFVRASQAWNATQQIADNKAGTSAAALLAGVLPFGSAIPGLGAATGKLAGLAGAVLPLNTADRAATSILGKLASSPTGDFIKSALPVAGGVAGTTLGTSPNLVQPTSSNLNSQLGRLGGGMTPQQGDQTNQVLGGLNPQDARQEMLTLGLYSPQGLSQLMMSPEQRKTAALTTQAQSSLDSLFDIYQQAGGGQGKLLGTLVKAGGAITGGTPSAYQRSLTTTAQQIAQATGADPKQVVNMLPQLTDTADAAASKAAGLKALLSTTLQSAQQTGLSGLNFGQGSAGSPAGSPSLLAGLGQ